MGTHLQLILLAFCMRCTMVQWSFGNVLYHNHTIAVQAKLCRSPKGTHHKLMLNITNHPPQSLSWKEQHMNINFDDKTWNTYHTSKKKPKQKHCTQQSNIQLIQQTNTSQTKTQRTKTQQNRCANMKKINQLHTQRTLHQQTNSKHNKTNIIKQHKNQTHINKLVTHTQCCKSQYTNLTWSREYRLR